MKYIKHYPKQLFTDRSCKIPDQTDRSLKTMWRLSLTLFLLSACSEVTAPKTPFILVTPAQQQLRDTDDRANIIVILTDDQGYADLGVHGVVSDIQTPHIDKLAADGVRLTAGYATAPQCTPSRAGLMTGRYQQRFGVDDNRYSPLPLTEQTIGNYLQDAGYHTGMAGKWHLEIDRGSSEIDQDSVTTKQRLLYFPDKRGFSDVFFGYLNHWRNNFDLAGNTVPIDQRNNGGYRVDVATDAGLAFIDRHKQAPFFLYLSYYAPHVPLDATEKYLSRHDSVAEVRRKYALAMMSSIDDGVGNIRQKLDDNGLTDNTLIFFISDNGAPLGVPVLDLPVDDVAGQWDGSLNNPWVGEKGMLSEGGIRVPYIVTWPDTLAAGTVVDHPISTLDVTSTSLAAANVQAPADLDGENLIPHLQGSANGLADRPLYWRFWSQSAVRQGDWKYLAAGDREYLFNLQANHETENLLLQHPDIAADLKTKLSNWSAQFPRPATVGEWQNATEKQWYDYYLACCNNQVAVKE